MGVYWVGGEACDLYGGHHRVDRHRRIAWRVFSVRFCLSEEYLAVEGIWASLIEPQRPTPLNVCLLGRG